MLISNEPKTAVELRGGVNLALTLDCGQAFRWSPLGGEAFDGVICGRRVAVSVEGDRLIARGVGDDFAKIWLENNFGTQVEAALAAAAPGLRFAFADDVVRFVESGAKLFPNQMVLRDAMGNSEMGTPQVDAQLDSCTNSAPESTDPPRDGELVSIIIANRLKALYRYDESTRIYRPDCVFSTPIARR